MKTSLNLRFGLASVLSTAGCALLLGGIYAGLLFGLGVLFFMPRSELTHPIARHELYVTLGVLAVVIAVAFVAKHLIPSSTADVVQRAVSHPAFVVPLWLFMLWGLYRNWQKERAAVNA